MVPSPSSPLALPPQHPTVPPDRSAQLTGPLNIPVLIAMAFEAPETTWAVSEGPETFQCPQQATVPPESNAQA